MRVLIVDDVPSARASLSAFLGLSEDIKLTGQAKDGADALHQISADPPDVVIMDIEMPQMDGLEATRELRAQGIPVHIVILSVASDRRAQALASGADAFLSKGEPLEKLLVLLDDFRPVPNGQEHQDSIDQAQVEMAGAALTAGNAAAPDESGPTTIITRSEIMATLTALKFNTPEGADQMLTKVQDLQKQQLIQIQDAAIVTWPQGAKKPKTKQLNNLAGAGALNGAFWGMLFGLLFFIPFVGLAIGAAMGALAGHFADYGIDDKFIEQTRSKVTEGTSALFLLTSGAVQDKVMEALKGTQAEVISTNLSKEQEAKLQEAFGE